MPSRNSTASAAQLDREPGGAEAVELHGARRHRQLRSRQTAAGAAPRSEVTDPRVPVVEWMRAAAAEARVGRVGEALLGDRRVVQPEGDDVRVHPHERGALDVVEHQLGDQRVVRVVDDRHGRRIQLIEGRLPPVGQHLELAEAIELVAEEVGEHDDVRLQVGCHQRKGGLVGLEHRDIAASPRAQESRGDPRAQVGSGDVVDDLAPVGAERFREHRRQRGLAVRRAHEHDLPPAPAPVTRERAQGVGREREQHLAGQRAALPARAARGEARECRHGAGEPERYADAPSEAWRGGARHLPHQPIARARRDACSFLPTGGASFVESTGWGIACKSFSVVALSGRVRDIARRPRCNARFDASWRVGQTP